MIAFSTIDACDGRVFIEKGSELFADDLLHDRADIAIAKALFCLPFKLRIGHFDRDDGGEPFAHVVAGNGNLVGFEQLVGLDVVY